MTLSLPTQKSEPLSALSAYLIMIYGRPGVGKTTLAAQFDDPLFLMFEPGAKALALYKREVSTWKKFKQYIELLKENPDQFKTVVIDKYARAYELCMEYVCDEMGIDHPQDAAYGKGWNAVDREWNRGMSSLALTGRGIVLICHAQDKDIEQTDGTVKEMTTPECTKQAMKFISRSVDLIAYYYYAKNGQRVIRVKGTAEIVAKNRIDGHFEGIVKFDAGETPADAYLNFTAAFNNKTPKENTDETRTASNGKNSEGLLRFRKRT